MKYSGKVSDVIERDQLREKIVKLTPTLQTLLNHPKRLKVAELISTLFENHTQRDFISPYHACKKVFRKTVRRMDTGGLQKSDSCYRITRSR